MKEDLVILYSGGADSRLMLEFARELDKKPYCVIIWYDQLNEKELESATRTLDNKKIPYHVVSINDLNIDSGLTGNGNINETGEVHVMHVPGRNTMFLSIAYSIAESKNIDTIWYGPDYSDRINLFPDCYQEYVVRVNQLFEIAGPYPIKVEAPLLGMTKETIIDILTAWGIDESNYFSGYGDIE